MERGALLPVCPPWLHISGLILCFCLLIFYSIKEFDTYKRCLNNSLGAQVWFQTQPFFLCCFCSPCALLPLSQPISGLGSSCNQAVDGFLNSDCLALKMNLCVPEPGSLTLVSKSHSSCFKLAEFGGTVLWRDHQWGQDNYCSRLHVFVFTFPTSGPLNTRICGRFVMISHKVGLSKGTAGCPGREISF